MKEPKLDAHCEAIMQEYTDNLSAFREKEKQITRLIKETLDGAGVLVASVESRVKTASSLRGKLALKGAKYTSLKDITDIVGVRVITFYTDDVDKVASAVERIFTVDWENSVDKRKLLQIDSFGYQSLHYICSLEGFPYRFEIQLRTLLQHAWANLNHDTGYKSGVEIPREYKRNLSRLAGMLELADEQFSRIRSDISDYRRRVQALVASGNLDEVALDGDSYRSFLNLNPFDKLNRRIASVNQAEIQEVSLLPYLPIFKMLECKTLGDVQRLIKEYAEPAFQLACYQIGLTDLDIISSSLAPQDICIAAILKRGGGVVGIRYMFDQISGPSEANEMLAEMIMEQAQDLPFMNQK